MKYLSTSSPSSSSTASSDITMGNSKSSTACCLAGIFRRILCSGGHPTHPFDQTKDNDSPEDAIKDQDHLRTKEKTQPTVIVTVTPPGIVARLMGLDSIPNNSTPNSLSRSKSMNSVDCMEAYDQKISLHRRVKSSLSLRAVPPYIELENENFFILSFENGCERKGNRSKEKKKEKGSGESSQRRTERCRNREETIRVSAHSTRNTINQFEDSEPLKKSKVDSEAGKETKPKDWKETLPGEKQEKNRAGRNCNIKKKIEQECSSEDLSPVFVLDFDRQIPLSENNSSCPPISRRELFPELEYNKIISLLINDNLFLMSNDERTAKVKWVKNRKESKKKAKQNPYYYMDMWSETCRVVEEELMGSEWIEGRTCSNGDIESRVAADVEVEILHQLLDELLDQLDGHFVTI